MSIAADLLIRVKSDTSQAMTGLSALSAGLVGLGLGAAAASVAFVRMGIDAQTSLAELQGYTGTSTTQLKAYTASLNTLAVKTGESLTALADGLYPVVSRGYQGADALKVLSLAAMDASASGARVVDVAGALSAVMSAYGAKAKDAGHYSDVMNAAITYGAQKFGDFAGAVGNTVSVAANLHIPFEQIAAAEATLTQHGMNANMAFTDMNFLIQKMYQPVGTLADQVKKLGGHFDGAKYSGLDLMGKLLYLRDATGLNSAEFLKLIGGMRSAKDAMGLLTDNGKTYTAVLDKMTGTGGRTAAAFAVHTKTLQFGFDQVGAAISVAALQLVTFVSPLVVPFLAKVAGFIATLPGDFNNFGTALSGVVGWFKQASPLALTVAGGLGALAGALAGVKLVAFGQALAAGATALWGYASAAWGAAAGEAAVAAPVTLVVAAVAGLAAAAFLAYQHFTPFHEAVDAVGKKLHDLWNQIQPKLLPALQTLGNLAKQVGGWIQDQLGGAFASIQPQLVAVWTELQNTATAVGQHVLPVLHELGKDMPTIIATMKTVVTDAMPVVQYLFTSAWDAMATAVSTAWGIIKGAVMVGWALVTGIIKVGQDVLKGDWGKAWGDLKGMVSGVFDGIGTIVSSAFGGIEQTVLNSITNIATLLAKVPGPIGDMARGVLGALPDAHKSAAKSIADATSNAALGAAGMKVSVVGHASQMKSQALTSTLDMSQGIVTQLIAAKDPATKAMLDLRLAVVTQTVLMQSQVVAHATTMNLDVVKQLVSMKDNGSPQAEALKVGVLTNFVTMEQQSVKTLDQQRQGILTQLKNTKDPAVRHSLEMQLGVVTHQEQMAKESISSATTMKTAVVKHFASMKTDSTKHSTDMGTTVKNTLSGAWKTVTGDIGGLATNIGTIFSGIGTFLHTFWNTLKAWVEKKVTDFVDNLKTTWDKFRKFIQPLWDTISGIIRVAFEIIGKLISNFGKWAHDQWNKVWDPIAKKATDIWNGISKFVGDKMSAIGTFFHDTWNKVQLDLGTAWAFISWFIGDKLHALGATVQKLVKPIQDALMGPFNWLKDHVGDILKSAANFGIDRLNDLQDALKNFLNLLAGGLNTLASNLGVKDRVPLWEPKHIPHLAAGAKNFAGGMALVGEEGPEIVQLPRGSTVIPARLSKALLGLASGGGGGLPGFAGGVGDIAGSIMGWLGGGASSLLHHVLDALGIGSLHLPQPLTAEAGALFNRVFNEALPKLQQWINAFTASNSQNTMPTGSMAHPTIGGNVVQWLLSAIAATHVPTSWVTGLEIIAQHESGGNPNAVNNWDSNARAGHPSMGLMQTIMSTFLVAHPTN